MNRFLTLTIAILLLVAGQARAQSPTPQAVLQNYATIVHANYADAHIAARELQQTIDAFLKAPSAGGLASARRAWLAARETYGQTEAFRFYGGPIDGSGGPEGRINSWPMDEAYVDSVRDSPKSGIVNNPKIAINRKTLSALNEKGGEENIATGWHAIEFLLWGQDLRADGPGDRTYTHFVDGGTAPNAARRRLYLKTVTDLLVDDLQSLVKAWAPNAKNFRASFVRNPANIAKILTGIGVLTRGELAGERLEVALDSQSQEDEHSCFSDNTHRDVIANAIGIRNVWRGEYKRADGSLIQGPSLRELVAAKDAAVASKVDALMDATVAAAQAIPAPFDQAILAGNPGRAKVEAVVVALKAQAQGLTEAARVLGLNRLNTSVEKK
ncbi:MAG: imelysin family protein [Burkholderiaceae bacterium]